MRVLLVALVIALIAGAAASVIGYLATGGDPQWSPAVAGVLGSLLTIAFSFFVIGGDRGE